MTRGEIEALVANYLNRTGDAIITAAIPFWFTTAHNDIQRLRNWKFQETTQYEVLHQDVDHYCAPTDIKEAYDCFSFDPNAQFPNRIIRFYHQVDISVIRDRRKTHLFDRTQWQTPDPAWRFHRYTHLFAIWAEAIEIYPPPGPELEGMQLQLDYYRWVQPPGNDCSDWLTLRGPDYLLYRSLVESVPFLDSTDQRLTVWGGLRQKAEKDLLGVDVSATWASDSLQMRG